MYIYWTFHLRTALLTLSVILKRIGRLGTYILYLGIRIFLRIRGIIIGFEDFGIFRYTYLTFKTCFNICVCVLGRGEGRVKENRMCNLFPPHIFEKKKILNVG